MDYGKSCISCGFGDELQELVTVRDRDSESWWIHPLCAEVRCYA